MLVNLRAGGGPRGAPPSGARAHLSRREKMRAPGGGGRGPRRGGDASRTNAVLVGDDLPELGADLVTALATLDSNDLTHVYC